MNTRAHTLTHTHTHPLARAIYCTPPSRPLRRARQVRRDNGQRLKEPGSDGVGQGVAAALAVVACTCICCCVMRLHSTRVKRSSVLLLPPAVAKCDTLAGAGHDALRHPPVARLHCRILRHRGLVRCIDARVCSCCQCCTRHAHSLTSAAATTPCVPMPSPLRPLPPPVSLAGLCPSSASSP